VSRKCSNLGFSMGIVKDVPKRLSRFESLAKNLGLSEDQWHSSIELKEFAMAFKDQFYVPTVCLNAWHIATIWDCGVKPTKLVPDTDLSLQDIPEEEQPAFTPDYL